MKRLANPKGSLALLLAFTLFLAACGEVEPEAGEGQTATEAEREAIEARLESYAPVLAEAYATGDIEILRPFAVERVLAHVEKRVSDLAAQGMLVEPEQTDLVVEKLETFGNDFALVTTLETWDIRYYSTGSSHSLIEERLGSRNRVEYQMKVLDGEWMIFFRDLKQEFDGT